MKIPKEFEDVFCGVELTEDEIRILNWIVGWERRTVENLRSAIRKAQATALSTLQAENARLRTVLASYQDSIVPELRAELEKVKAELAQEREDFVDYACSGVPNLAPYCLNRKPDCVDERGWCVQAMCHGFRRENECCAMTAKQAAWALVFALMDPALSEHDRGRIAEWWNADQRED